MRRKLGSMAIQFFVGKISIPGTYSFSLWMETRFFVYDLVDTLITVLGNYGIELANPGPVMFKEAACVNSRNALVREDLVEQLFKVASDTFHLCRRAKCIPPFKKDADVFLQYFDVETGSTLEKDVRRSCQGHLFPQAAYLLWKNSREHWSYRIPCFCAVTADPYHDGSVE